jgi:CSLREA domain-containing protein
MSRFSSRGTRAAWSNTTAGQVLTTLLLGTGWTTAAHAGNTIYVTTTEQDLNDNGECSLQEAIYSANFDDNVAIVATNPDQVVDTACVAGNADDTIVLPAGAVFPMSFIVDDAHNPFGPTATPIVTSAITLEANGARLEHVPNGVNFRAFAVGEPDEVFGPGSLTIRNAWIRGFTTKGGNGAGGGGGGLGAGGAIYVSWSSLTIENSTFEGNGAAGGNGSHNGVELMGGGGGRAGW